MNMVVMGMSYRTAQLKIREKFAFENGEISDVLRILKEKYKVEECAILSTCNRVEIYALVGDINSYVANLKELLCTYHNFAGSIDQYVYTYANSEMIGHLCRVCSGLDSLVLGEPQIFGQVKDSYKKAVDYHAIGPVFRILFNQVFSCVKKVRSATEIGRKHLSTINPHVRIIFVMLRISKSSGFTGICNSAHESKVCCLNPEDNVYSFT